MKKDVINSEHSIAFGKNGEITVLGTSPGNVLIMVRSWQLNNLPRQEFMQDQLFTYSRDTGEPTFVFQYALKSELRNPRKLLRSVRNKIMAVLRVIEEEAAYWEESYNRPFILS